MSDAELVERMLMRAGDLMEQSLDRSMPFDHASRYRQDAAALAQAAALLRLSKLGPGVASLISEVQGLIAEGKAQRG